eukprot:scaffold307855_cov24-Tisochrysis_lutea.AAC.1
MISRPGPMCTKGKGHTQVHPSKNWADLHNRLSGWPPDMDLTGVHIMKWTGPGMLHVGRHAIIVPYAQHSPQQEDPSHRCSRNDDVGMLESSLPMSARAAWRKCLGDGLPRSATADRAAWRLVECRPCIQAGALEPRAWATWPRPHTADSPHAICMAAMQR